ncbi:MAG: 3'-5' exonuclease, partial [Gemmatimonadota bacterium]
MSSPSNHSVAPPAGDPASPPGSDGPPALAGGDAPEVGFLLHVFHRDQASGTAVYGVGRLAGGDTFAFLDGREPPSFFLRCSDLEAALPRARRLGAAAGDTGLTTMDGEPVARLSHPRLGSLRQLADELARAGLRTYEADVAHSRHYLMARGLRGPVAIRGSWRPGTGVRRVYREPELVPANWEPALSVLALDIETDPSVTRLLAVSLVGFGAMDPVEEVHLVGPPAPGDPAAAVPHPDERALLQALAARIRALDPDVLTGWNVVDFDLPVLQRRYRASDLPFNLGRSNDDSWYREGDVWGGSRMVVYGRQVLDALHLVRATGSRYDDFRLDTVARAVLGRGKTLEAGTDEDQAQVIFDAYRGDRAAFWQYCLEDSRLVRDLIQRENLVQLSLHRSVLTGLPLERAWGSVAAFDFLYISQLRRRGLVAPSIGVDRSGLGGAPGGLVMPARAGLYRHVFVFDFKSLYPSLIRTFNIDPWARVQARRARECGQVDGLIAAPNGAAFVREPGILPEMLEEFFNQRQRARQAG